MFNTRIYKHHAVPLRSLRRWAAIGALQRRVEASDAPLTNAAIERLWLATRDLMQAEQPKEAQAAALSFVCALLHAPREPLSDPNRTFIFGVIRGHETAEHVPMQLDAVRLLTDNGTQVTFLEESLAAFLLEVFPQALRFRCFHNLLWLLERTFALHISALDPAAVLDLVTCVCHTCSISSEPVDIKGCLVVMRTVVESSHLTPPLVLPLLTALCRTVQIEQVRAALLNNATSNLYLYPSKPPTRLLVFPLPPIHSVHSLSLVDTHRSPAHTLTHAHSHVYTRARAHTHTHNTHTQHTRAHVRSPTRPRPHSLPHAHVVSSTILASTWRRS
jgi:hypothetical protein